MPGWSLEAEGKQKTPLQVLSWSASGACARKGTMLVRGSQKRTGLDHHGAPEKEDMPRARPQARIESRG
jgi:hypothetical protein